MEMYLRKLLIIILLTLVSGCRPTPLNLFVQPDGPPDYKLGWEDGCDTGMSAQDTGYIYRAMYGYKRRAEMMENALYKEGWTEGFQYCRFSASALHEN